MAGPRISVIITNYNYAQFLGSAIQSIVDQTYQNVECLVVDDGSSDNSVAVATNYPQAKLITKANGGQVSAAKAAMALVTGELIVFLDSDDMLDPDACAVIAADFDPNVVLYQGALDIVTPDGRRVGRYPDAPLIAHGQCRHVLRHGYFPASPTSGNAFRADHVRRMLDAAGDDLRYFVDGYLIYSAPFFGEVKRLNATLGRYLVHGGNVSLSAGVNRRSAEKSLRNAIWQRSGIVNALRITGRSHGSAVDYLTAWQLRHLLLLRHCFQLTDLAPELTEVEIARRMMVKFMIYPGITVRQRVTNILLPLALFLGMRTLGPRILPMA